MFRSPLSRKPAGRATTTRARRFAYAFSLLIVAAVLGLPFISAGAQEDGVKDELQTLASQPAVKSKSNVIAGAEFVPGEVLVRFRDETSAKNAEASAMSLLPADGGEINARIEKFEGSDIVRGLRLAKVDAARTIEAVAELSTRADVVYAEPNYIWRAKRTPNDPRYTSGEMYGLNRINAPAAWDRTVGSRSVVVGVLDGGVDINHPDLQANIWTNPGDPVDGADNDGNGFIDDNHGWDFHNNNNSVFDNEDGDDHATHVAGTIGATGDNNQGVTGVNWEVSIMSLKVLGPQGGSTSKIINGYNYARMMRERWDNTGGAQGANIRVLNNSYGGSGKSLAALDAILQLNNAGILFVVAAGNGGGDSIGDDNFSFPDFPSNYDSPNVIAVASTNSADTFSSFSNFSSRLVSMGAPGSSILSTTPNGTYSVFSGTSMASPHVAGAAALVCAANPNITLAQLRGVIAYTGDRMTAPLDAKTTTGRRLNVANAVAAAVENGGSADATAPAPAGNFRVVAQNGRSITLAWTAPGDDNGSGTAADYDFFYVNPTTQAKTLLPTTLAPQAGGTQQSVVVNVPFRNFSGTIQLRAYDNAGNTSTTAVGVTVPVNSGSDPYTVALTGAESLSTSTATNLFVGGGDDKYASYNLPFSFPFYGANRNSLTVSTNGTLYFSVPPRRDNGDGDDAGSSVEGLQGQTMIAGLWDDIDINPTLRPGSGVYVAQSDATKVIFRWQGVTFNTPRGQINFEIELRPNGTVIMRYGANTNIFPVVGMSGGEPDAYVVASHTSETQSINLTGAQTVTFAPRANVPDTPAVLAFQTSSMSANESAGKITVNVARTGNTQNGATVTVQTVDNTAAVRCDDTTTLPGVAFARCDYATTVATLNFAPNETTKSVTVLLIDDAYVEPTETIQLSLSNPNGINTLGAQTTMTLNILNTDQAGQANPIFTTAFFVRQQYLDFLSREPEANEPWSPILNNCSDVNNNPACDRITVSKSFFGSPEFQLKGFYVYRFYRLSFNRLPLYTEITPDMSSVTGADAAELYQKKAAFADNWVQRPSFKALYDNTTAADFVNTLMDRFALPSITTPDPAAPDGAVKVTLTRAELASRLNAGTLTRAQVVRAIADSDQVAALEYTRAYVSMQYFGYLRRDPDTGGFNGWINYLNEHPNDDRTMVNGFMNSVEYRLRFGQ